MADIEYSKATIKDDKGRVLKEPTKEDKPQGKFMWWKEDDETTKAGMIAATLKHMQFHNSARMDQLTVSTRLYGNNSAFSLMGSSFTRASAVGPSPSSQRISYNLCSSVVDTLTAQVASKAKIIPTFITSGGSWGMQRKAENLSKFVDGCFYENKVHDKMVEQFNDGACWGDGLLHVFRSDEDRASVERVFPHELLVDEVEAMIAKPRQMHRIKYCDRDVLKDIMSDVKGAAEKIDSAMPASMQDVSGEATAGDLICVVESWHLPSGKGATDGEHCISIEDKILTCDQYDKDYFPFVHFRYNKRKIGYWGQGAIERLQNLQGEINRLMILIQKSMWLGGSFKILVPVGSKIVTQHLNNDVGAIVHYSGEPPTYITPPMIQNDIYPYVDTLIERGYKQEGVSMQASTGEVPIGVKSGTAMRTYDKISDDRQLRQGQGLEAAALEIGRQMIEVIKDIFKDKKTYKVTWPGTKFVESIDWKDVNLEEDEYYLKAFPTSSFPEEPTARLETITEYMQAGMVSPRAGRRLLRTEDIEMSDMLANAAEDLICKTIEEILYDKIDTARPDGNWDLQLAKQLSIEYMNYARVNNCPLENQQLLMDFQGYIDEELGLTAPPPPAVGQPGAPGGPAPQANGTVSPMANPMPTPQSPMVPNSAGATQ